MCNYFEALFSKDLTLILDVFDENVEWLIAPIGEKCEKHQQAFHFDAL
jgi:hypothetical protein